VTENTPKVQPPQAPGLLHPAYSAATQDTQIVIRFVGNTARIAGFGFQGDLDPFQVEAASWWLKRQAELMIVAQEREAARNRIVTAGQLPPDGFITPEQALRGGPR
jgi:hypothetical protein